MIERYKVLDLWPCGQSELIIFGLNESEEKNSAKTNGEGGQPTSITAEKSKKAPSLVSPDISQMTPFKVLIRFFIFIFLKQCFRFFFLKITTLLFYPALI